MYVVTYKPNYNSSFGEVFTTAVVQHFLLKYAQCFYQRRPWRTLWAFGPFRFAAFVSIPFCHDLRCFLTIAFAWRRSLCTSATPGYAGAQPARRPARQVEGYCRDLNVVTGRQVRQPGLEMRTPPNFLCQLGSNGWQSQSERSPIHFLASGLLRQI